MVAKWDVYFQGGVELGHGHQTCQSYTAMTVCDTGVQSHKQCCLNDVPQGDTSGQGWKETC